MISALSLGSSKKLKVTLKPKSIFSSVEQTFCTWSEMIEPYTDLRLSNFREKKLCLRAVMYLFEWNFRME